MTTIEYTTLDTTDPAAAKAGDRVTITIDRNPDVGEVRGIAYDAGGTLCVAGWLLSRSTIVRIERPVVPVPPLPTEPGTAFRATVYGVPDILVVATDASEGEGGVSYVTPIIVNGCRWHTAEYIDASTVQIIDTTAVKA